MADSMDERMYESSSPSRGYRVNNIKNIKTNIYNKLMNAKNKDAIANQDFKDQLDAHFNRLPLRYLVDINVDRAEDVLLHQHILAEAKDPTKCVVFHVRLMKIEEAIMDMGTTTEDTEDGMNVDEVAFARHDVIYAPIHEIILCSIEKPKLLSQLSSIVPEIGLNIREAHCFSTTDGYALCIFVVEGWGEEDADGLHIALEAAIVRRKA